MANTYITSGASFRPYTFAEMLQPVQIYTDAYNKVEDELANLDIMAGDVASKLTNTPEDQELKKLYETFNTELTKASEELYSKGLSTQTRKRLSGLKAQYAEKLNPINEAYKAYAEDQKYLTRLKREHPEMLVEGIGNSISDYMYGNTPAGLTANTEDIYNKSMKAAAGTSSRFSETLKPTGILGNQYYQFVTQQGITQEAVDKLRGVIDNPMSEEAQKYLNTDEGRALYEIVSERRKASNYDSFTKEGKNRIDASILSGIFSGVSYKENIDRVSNKGWKAPTITPSTPPATRTGINTTTLGSIPVDSKLGKQAEKDLNFIKTLNVIRNSDGSETITTPEIATLQKEIDTIIEKLTSTDFKSDFMKRRSLERDLNNKQWKLDELSRKMSDKFGELDNKYSYLNLDAMSNISLGISYDDARSKEEIFVADSRYSPEYEEKLNKAVKNTLVGLSQEGNVGIFNPGATKSVSASDSEKLLDNSQVIVKSDEGIVLKTPEGIKTIKGIDDVDAFNASYKKTTNFLKDYSKEGLQNESILEGDLETIQNLTFEDINALYQQNKLKAVSADGGDVFYGITIKDSNAGDIYKVLIHGATNAMYISSLKDVTVSGGASIRKYQEDMLSRGLKHFFDINTQKP